MRLVIGSVVALAMVVAGVACGSATQEKATDGSVNGNGDNGSRDRGDGGIGDAGHRDAGGLEACGNAPGQLFPPGSTWNTPVDIASTKLDGESSSIVDNLQKTHTADARFQIDFSLKLLHAEASTPRLSFERTDDFFTPDCDPAPLPVPVGGSIEGESGYACEGGGDCHLLVVDRSTCRLHEMWRANFSGGDRQGGCQVIWDLTQVYPESLRGAGCTSADAAGLPISAHLFSADEIKAGAIEHAIRFVMPNELIRNNTYVFPATHATNSSSSGASGGLKTPPYGARLRLKATTNLGALKPAAKIVAKALMKYGMILSDGGNITFTAMADDETTAQWSEVDLGPHDLKALQWSDFEMVSGGTRFQWHDDCQRTPITQ